MNHSPTLATLERLVPLVLDKSDRDRVNLREAAEVVGEWNGVNPSSLFTYTIDQCSDADAGIESAESAMGC